MGVRQVKGERRNHKCEYSAQMHMETSSLLGVATPSDYMEGAECKGERMGKMLLETYKGILW